MPHDHAFRINTPYQPTIHPISYLINTPYQFTLSPPPLNTFYQQHTSSTAQWFSSCICRSWANTGDPPSPATYVYTHLVCTNIALLVWVNTDDSPVSATKNMYPHPPSLLLICTRTNNSLLVFCQHFCQLLPLYPLSVLPSTCVARL